MKNGVHQNAGGQWTFHCPKCREDGPPVSGRREARELYRKHRTGCGAGAPPKAPPGGPVATVPPIPRSQPQEEGEATVPTTKRKAASKVAKKKTATKRTPRNPDTQMWSLAFVVNPSTGREIAVGTNRQGGLLPKAIQERLGMATAPKWGRVEARSRTEAIEFLRAGKGEWYTASGKAQPPKAGKKK